MLLSKIKEILNAEVIYGKDMLNINIRYGCGADLMSDVLAFIKEEALLLTGLTNSQLIKTAEIVDIKAICLVRGKNPDNDCIELAKNKKIPLLKTKLPMYEACGRLYKEGLSGCSEA